LIWYLASEDALEVSKPKLKLPKIAVYRVDSEFDETNIAKEIYSRNEDIQQFLEYQKMKTSINTSFVNSNFGKQDPTAPTHGF
jgi:hypothetical protein